MQVIELKFNHFEIYRFFSRNLKFFVFFEKFEIFCFFFENFEMFPFVYPKQIMALYKNSRIENIYAFINNGNQKKKDR